MSWEDDDFTPVLPGSTVKKNWEEEDKNDDDAPASWEEATDTKAKPAAKPAAPTADKSTAAPKPAAKAKAKAKPAPAEPSKPLSKEEQESAKKKAQDEVIKADFANTKDLFSGIADKEAKTDPLATFVPITDADFIEFATKLNEKMTPHKSSFHYNKFAKTLLRHLTSDMKPEEVKELISVLNVVTNEKLAAEKAKDSKGKAKKKPVTKKLNVGRADSDEEEGGGDDLDAFM